MQMLLSLTGLTLALAGGASARQSSSQDILDDVQRALGFAPSELVRLDVPATVGQPIVVDVAIGGVPYQLDLAPSSVRAASFEVLAQGEDGRLRRVDPGPARTLRGELVGDPSGKASAALLDDGLHAWIRTSDGMWSLEPAVAYSSRASFGDYVLYRAPDDFCYGLCGADLIPGSVPPVLDGGGQTLVPGESLWVAELGIDADHQFYNIWGSVPATENRVESVINTMNAQYEDELNITHVITTIIVRTSAANDPYTVTDPGALLGQFQNEWNANQGSVQRDVAELFTGKNMDGSVIGIAYLGVVCNKNSAYNVVQHLSGITCATDLSAHELGHNWGADHCNCPNNTMNPGLTCTNNFHNQETVPEILAFRNSRTCLDLFVDGTQLFGDTFESGDFTSGGWVTFNNRATVHGQAAFDGAWGANLKKTTQIQRPLSTAGFANVSIEFSHRSLNYEGSESLIVEWFDGANWILVASLTGIDWKEKNYILPSGAGNNPGFSIRFRTTAHGPNSVTGKKKKSHVDDVRVIGWN